MKWLERPDVDVGVVTGEGPEIAGIACRDKAAAEPDGCCDDERVNGVTRVQPIAV